MKVVSRILLAVVIYVNFFAVYTFLFLDMKIVVFYIKIKSCLFIRRRGIGFKIDSLSVVYPVNRQFDIDAAIIKLTLNVYVASIRAF